MNKCNVRRLAFVLEKRGRLAIKSLVYDPKPFNEQRFVQLIENIIKETGYVGEFEILPKTVDLYEFNAKVGVRPAGATEFVWVNFNVYRSPWFVMWLKR